MANVLKKQNGFYIDPSVEFILGRLNGVSYDATIAGVGSMHVKSDAVNSAVGRLSIGIGKETEKSNIFAKLALAHEFSGKVNNYILCTKVTQQYKQSRKI